MGKKRQRKTRVMRSGNFGIIQFSDCAYSFEISGGYSLATQGVLPLAVRQGWEQQPFTIGSFKIIPHGKSNQLPYELRDILEENNLTEGVFKRQRGLLWGQGPALYQEEFVNGEKQRTWVTDPEVEQWLRSFDYQEQLRRAIVDYYHTEGHYALLFLNRASRISAKTRIERVEHVGYHKARLEWPEDLVNIKRIITGDWYNPNILGLTAYPVFNALRPFDSPVSMMFCNMYSFAHDFYGLPAYYGALNWIRKGSAIPKILEALSKNSLNIKWHIKSPASYWDAKRTLLMEKCSNENTAYKEEMLEDLKDEIFKQLAEVLSGEVNVGKFFTSEKLINDLGQMEEWSIEPIDQKVKEFVESQVLIAKQADSAITSGMGLHPSLSNIMVDGKLASGSEQLYALKLYLATEVDIPESIICRPINTAIAVNWPEKNLNIGFYHQVVKTEDSVTSQNRVKNAI
ncbi:MAG: hypothetical protein NTU44_13520 [Bacteroidetes bacterium]|nr:hypothetical protein [Bacteroidota bacterium]